MLGPWAVPEGTNANGDQSAIHSRPMSIEASKMKNRRYIDPAAGDDLSDSGIVGSFSSTQPCAVIRVLKSAES